MMRLFHWAAAALLLLCGWLTGSAFQARTEQHILQLQRTVELLQRIRQEIAYRRLDLEQLQRCLVQEKAAGKRCSTKTAGNSGTGKI